MVSYWIKVASNTFKNSYWLKYIYLVFMTNTEDYWSVVADGISEATGTWEASTQLLKRFVRQAMTCTTRSTVNRLACKEL